MKRIALPLLLAVLAASCSPETYTLHLDVRQPSASGLDLSRKSFAIVYMDGRDPSDSVFNSHVATAFARALEEDYFGGEEVVSLFATPSADSLTLDDMRSFVMDTNEDVVFLIGAPAFGEMSLERNQAITNARTVDSAFVCPATVPFSTRMSVYDSMGADEVKQFAGNSNLRFLVYNNGMMPEENLKEKAFQSMEVPAEKIGTRLASGFLSNWKAESFSFYYYEGWDNAWIDALESVSAFDWHGAIDQWVKLLSSKDSQKKACASYNIANAFYLLGDSALAGKWLDQADKFCELSLSPGLRKRIASANKK